jgi:integrase
MRGTVRRIRVEESTGLTDKRQAEVLRAKREAEIVDQSIHGRRTTATFAAAVVSYLEAGGSRRFLDHVLEHFGTTPLVHIDQAAIDRGARMLYPHASGATRDRQFYTPVSAVMKHAAKRNWCSPLLDLERPDKPRGRVRALTIDEANRLIDACGDHLRPLVIFMLYTGARVGEALWLDWREVNLDRRHVVFVETKNGDRRGVPLHPRVVAALANLPHRQGEVFRRPDGLSYAPLNADDPGETSAGGRIKTAFRGAVRRAGLIDFHPHDCRHTWATWHYAQHRDPNQLMALGGWRTPAMVFRYAHNNVEQFQSSIDALPTAGGNPGDSEITEGKTAWRSMASSRALPPFTREGSQVQSCRAHQLSLRTSRPSSPDLPRRSKAARRGPESGLGSGGSRLVRGRGRRRGLDRASALLLRWRRLGRRYRLEFDEQRIGIEQRGASGPAGAGLARYRPHRPGFSAIAVERDGDGEIACQAYAQRAGRAAGAPGRELGIGAGWIGFDRQ